MQRFIRKANLIPLTPSSRSRLKYSKMVIPDINPHRSYDAVVFDCIHLWLDVLSSAVNIDVSS